MPDAPRFDPVIQRMVEGFAARAGVAFDPAGIPAIRARFDTPPAEPRLAPGVTIEDVEAGGVPVRLYRPPGPGPHPLHLYLHGGGFVFGRARSGTFDAPLAERALRGACLVASVDYRLAPEHRFPAGLEDCHAALVALVSGAAAHAIAPHAVSLGGASSGGNFVAALTLMARERSGPPLAFQLLEIAGTDLTKSSQAWLNPAPGHDTSRARDLALVDLYLPDLASRAHPWASPLFAPDLAGLPPAYVMSGELDPRRDECEAYVARLQDAGVDALARTLAGHVHGSMMLPDWAPAIAWRAEADAILAAANAAALAGQPFSPTAWAAGTR